MNRQEIIPSSSFIYAQDGTSARTNELGMRPMQKRAYDMRGEQYLLIKSPPASGKSRALMFIALDKLHEQGLRKAIITVPEKTIGASFADTPLTEQGFYHDWKVVPKWNLCNAPGFDDGSKVESVRNFLAGEDRILVCPHATFRNSVEKFGVEAFDDCLISIDEFHHVSANPENKLGVQTGDLINRNKVHLVAMTGSYFRGDAEPVLMPEVEMKFQTVTYTYYEQLNGYEYLKELKMSYAFYTGSYADDILKVLDPNEKTIIHIPSVNSRESTRDKHREVEHILEELGKWEGTDEETGFQLVRTAAGRLLRVADLVDDDPKKRDRVSAALKVPALMARRDHVDIIIALGMAKEGFDWIWCEHALTVGYRSSLTEIVQIIGRATRDAKGKTSVRFTNLIAEPDASGEAVREAVNDTLKAIAASLLMEQVLAPRFNFTAKNPASGPEPGFDYGEEGYKKGQCNLGMNRETGEVRIEIKGLAEPNSEEAKRICREDLNEVVAATVQDAQLLERAVFDEETPPQELNQVVVARIVQERYSGLDEEDREAVRQRTIAAVCLVQEAQKAILDESLVAKHGSNALIHGVRKFIVDVRELDIDLIDSINPFSQAYQILAKTMNEESLKRVAEEIAARRSNLTMEEARDLTKRAVRFKEERGRVPSIKSSDPWERRMAEGVAFLNQQRRET